ncbi:TetR/AcrR family transcriptional regulator [Brevundimonas sp. PAMC22021]|uniref:TetR/AcrR family transcriptional regulator n=1 Tax=Brevundimonas sp. PAMC22021 TaxID=2861285 RepID=UPI001C62D55D|nr:TetR/AcrR family transcriptional regulator [Brevundimonas sp. PAMC22021]QYF85814.1 TetR/AcrR family transcriptional regulator [Brevundimonas sp. PAMC22021]
MSDTLAPTRAGAPTPGSRADAKMRTRFEIRSAAVELFREQGFNSVTTEQIAARVGVTQRTLFRHFKTKDAILFDGDTIVEYYAETLGRHLPDNPPIEALRRAFMDTAASYDRNADLFRANHEVILQSELLQAFARQRTSRIDDLIALALDGHRVLANPLPVPTLAARVAAATCMGYVRALMDAWLEGKISGPMVGLAQRIWPRAEALLLQCRLDVDDRESGGRSDTRAFSQPRQRQG